MPESARCPECDWHRETTSGGSDKLAAIINELEGHLAATHDWTWQRAHEHARALSRQVLNLPDAQAAEVQRRAKLTARCPKCDWQTVAPTEEFVEVSRCSAELDQHLRMVHDASPGEAAEVRDAWAHSLLGGRIR